jgi:hypothetical protein
MQAEREASGNIRLQAGELLGCGSRFQYFKNGDVLSVFAIIKSSYSDRRIR